MADSIRKPIRDTENHLVDSEPYTHRYAEMHDSNLNKTEFLVNQLGLRIITRKIGVDMPIPSQREISETYALSRIVVREATQILKAKGMLYSCMSKGTWVAPQSNWDLFDGDILNWFLRRGFSQELHKQFNQMRLSMQPQSASLMARHANQESIDELRLLASQLSAQKLCLENRKRFELEFHTHILVSSKNRFYAHLIPLLETAWAYNQMSIEKNNFLSDTNALKLYHHIYVHISSRREHSAAIAMRRLVGLQNNYYTPKRSIK